MSRFCNHLGTPRSVIDPVRDVAIWQWPLLGNAFGDAAPVTDPDGDGVAFAMNLRFPGQYFDAETGLHYNYYRDYDPSTGRYVESDPIGLGGGIHSYVYALSSPISFGDSSGLFVDEAGKFLVQCAKPVVAVSTVLATGAVLLITPSSTSACDTLDKPVECRDDCDTLYRQIRSVLGELKRRYWEMRDDKQDLFNTNRTGRNSWEGHQQQFQNKQATLRYLLWRADQQGCFAYPEDSWSWATRSPPIQPGP